ncbi:aldo/keto reductase [Streptosporangium minutum]
MRRAADAGVTFFDTADVYSAGSSEEVTGNLLREIFSHRTTTCWPPSPQ